LVPNYQTSINVVIYVLLLQCYLCVGNGVLKKIVFYVSSEAKHWDFPDWLEKGQIRRLVLVINSVATKEVLERWDFQIDCEATAQHNDNDVKK
jgi:hypothetical protein